MKGTEVYKFGGASVSSADAVRNAVKIIRESGASNLVLVVSAMGKTTSNLHLMLQAARQGKETQARKMLSELAQFHWDITNSLFEFPDVEVTTRLQLYFTELKVITGAVSSCPEEDWDRWYDQTVCYGELISTTILWAAMTAAGLKSIWHDSRTLVCTDMTYREAKVNWEKTASLIESGVNFSDAGIHIVQGFISAAPDGSTTTLGLEGSDFSAAIFAWSLRADRVTLWKNVAGVYTADPNRKPADQIVPAAPIAELSYFEVLQMANYGAKVIHPKTLKPLENRAIPLSVRSFIHVDAPGTSIGPYKAVKYPPIAVYIDNLTLLTLQLGDLSYIREEHVDWIFQLFRTHRIKTYVMEIGLMTLNMAVGGDPLKIQQVKEELSGKFQLKWNSRMELLTVRHYTESELSQIRTRHEIFLEQRTRQTAMLLYRMPQ